MDEIIDLLDSAAKSYPMKALADDIGKAESTLRNELTEQPGYKTGLRTAIKIWDKTGDSEANKCVKEVIQAITALARIKMCLEGFTGERP